MRTPIYLLTIASCIVLGGFFAARGQWIPLALVSTVAVIYLVRLVTKGREQRRLEIDEAKALTVDNRSEQENLKAELREAREAYERNRRVLILITVMLAGGAAIAWSWNPLFALAVLTFALPPLYLIWRNSTAIRMIDDGLSRAA